VRLNQMEAPLQTKSTRRCGVNQKQFRSVDSLTMNGSHPDPEPSDERLPLPLLPATISAFPFSSDQLVCSRSDCQRRRRRDYHRRKIETDPVYAQVVRDNRRKWRQAHPDYQKTTGRLIPRPPNATANANGSAIRNAACRIL